MKKLSLVIMSVLLCAYEPYPGPNSVKVTALDTTVQYTVTSPSFGNCKATTNSSVDCLAAFNAAIAAMGADAAHPRGGDLVVPAPQLDGAYYYLSGPLHITRTLRIHGSGGTGSNQYLARAQLVFPAGSNGIVVDWANGTTKDGIGAEIDHLSIVSSSFAAEWTASASKNEGAIVIPRNRTGYVYVNLGSTGTTGSTEPSWNTTIGGTTSDGSVTWTTTVASGIQMLAYASVHDVSIFGFSGNGIHIEASTPTANANQWKLKDSFIQGNAGSGLFVTGNDVNAGYANGTVFDGNDAWGINELSALGNQYGGNEISGNGYLFYASGAPGQGLWQASTSYAAATRILPTIKNGYVFKTTSGGTSGMTEPTWPTTIGNTVSDGTVTWTCFAHYQGGSVNFGDVGGSDASVGNGNYIEAGQYPLVVGNYASWQGGANGSGVASSSTGIYDIGIFSSGRKFFPVSAFLTNPITDSPGVWLGQSSTYPMIWDTLLSSGSNKQYDLSLTTAAGLTNIWVLQSQASDSLSAIGFTTAASVRSAFSAAADVGVSVFRNGMYFGQGAQRIYSTADAPGSTGKFGDLSFRDYQNASVNDGALSYVNTNNTGGNHWARGVEYLQGQNAKTTTYQLVTEDSKQTFSNYGTSAEVEFDLVNYGDEGIANYGWWADFVVEDTHGMKIYAKDRADIIYLGASVTATNGYIESTTKGSMCHVLFTRFEDAPTNTVGAFFTNCSGTWAAH